MALRIFRGAIDSDMISECIAQIEADKESKHIVIVPEHYSYEMERMMVDRFGVIGINNIMVYTPHRMAVNCLETDASSYLTAAGKQMLAVRSVRECIEADGISDAVRKIMGARPFTDSMVTLISELKRRGIAPAVMTETAVKMSGADRERSRLVDKLKASALVYEKYEELLDEGNYVDIDDDMVRLAGRIASGGIIDKNTRVWFMRFDEYLPNHMRLIGAVCAQAAEVTVCLGYVKAEESSSDDENDLEIYMPMEKSYRRLLDEGCAEDRFFPHKSLIKRKSDIDFLIRHFGAFKSYRYGDEEKGIELIECPDPHTEVEYIAERIHTLIRESREEHDERVRKIKSDKKKKKYTDEEKAILSGRDILRYRDIGILFGNADEYTHILDAVFSEHNIPYFADERIVLSEHPIAVQLLSVFDIFETDWSHESVFRYLNAGFVFEKTEEGFSRLDMNDISRLESCAERYNIRGRRRWLEKRGGELKPWSFTGFSFDDVWGDEIRDNALQEHVTALVNETRAKICPPLEHLIPENSDERKSVGEHSAALIAFLREINMYEGLESDICAFENDSSNPGAQRTAQQFSQIWNGILDVIEQIRVTMSAIKMTFAEFGEYMRAGLSRCEIRTIPSALDSVYTGSVERSTSAPVKCLFAAGAVSGTYPSPTVTDGYFSDADRELMCGFVELAPAKEDQRAMQSYKVYKALRAASEKITVTYPLQNSIGEACRRSGFITDIADMFGTKEQAAFPSDSFDERNITSEYAAKRNLLINCASPVNALPPVWQSVYRCLRDSGKHNDTLNRIGLAASFYSHLPSISCETARMLYSKDIDGSEGRVYSATRLDAYSDCPMKFFLRFGLKLSEEERGGIQANEVGTYVHRLVQEVCARVPENYSGDEEGELREMLAWRGMDIEKLNNMISGIVDETRQRMPKSTDDYNMRMRVMDRIESSVKRGAVNVLNSLSSGSFIIKDTELDLDRVQLEDGIYIKGFVDRVDEYLSDKYGHFLRIIDYKTGRQDFSERDIRNGRNMQLMVYAIAAQLYYEAEGDGEYSLAGVYYQHMRDRYISGAEFSDNEGAAKKEIYLNGSTYFPDDADRREELFAAISDKPEYIGIALKKDGTPDSRYYKKESERDELVAKVKSNIKGMDDEIMSGRIFPRPYSEGSSCSCDFCGYKDICSFEKEKSVRFKEEGGADFGTEK